MDFLEIKIPAWRPRPAFSLGWTDKMPKERLKWRDPGKPPFRTHIIDESHPRTKIAQLWKRYRAGEWLPTAEWDILWNAYMESNVWAMRRDRVLHEFPVCRICKQVPSQQAHHIHYRNKFKEKSDDLLAVCKKCHEDFSRKLGHITDTPPVPVERVVIRERTSVHLKWRDTWEPEPDPVCPCDPCQGLAKGACWMDRITEKLYFESRKQRQA